MSSPTQIQELGKNKNPQKEKKKKLTVDERFDFAAGLRLFQDAWVDSSDTTPLIWMEDDRRRVLCQDLSVEYIETPTTFHFLDWWVEDLILMHDI